MSDVLYSIPRPLEASVNETEISAHKLYICALQSRSTVGLVLYVNQSIDSLAPHYVEARLGSEGKGVDERYLGIFTTGAYTESCKRASETGELPNDWQELPGSGVVIKVCRNLSVDLTKTVTNLAEVWAELLGVELSEAYVDRWLGYESLMSVEELLMVDSSEGFVLTSPLVEPIRTDYALAAAS